MINNQEVSVWVVISCILITLMFDSAFILKREIRCWSLYGVSWLTPVEPAKKSICNFSNGTSVHYLVVVG